MKDGLNLRERDDDYAFEICRVGRYRVISCRDNIQWIIQRQDRQSGDRRLVTPRWRGLSYCQTKPALERDWRRHTGDVLPVELAMLPETHGLWRTEV